MSSVTTLACVTGLALAALALPPPVTPVHAQSAALVLCDRIAADPSDPDKPRDIIGVPTVAPSDIAIALKYCRIAAARSPRAMYELGRAYAADKRWPQAASAYRKAAAKGSTSAMVALGRMMQKGTGIAKNEAEARALIARAAKAGNPAAVAHLDALSGKNAGPPLDPVKARALLAKAAAANSAEAQYQLGLMYANGIGGPKDQTAARAMFAKAAAQGHAAALDWMGAYALSGIGGPKDKTAAKAYYEKAAALGNADAKAALKRLACPYVVRDKRGDVLTHLCF